MLEDAPDDAAARALGAVDASVYDTTTYDLLRLTIDERPQAFDFQLQVQDLERELETILDSGVYNVDFQHADAGYRLEFTRSTFFGPVSYFGALQLFDSGRQQYVTIERMPVQVQPGEGTLTMTVPREMLLDGNGTAPQLGREFSFFKAFSRSNFLFGDGFSALSVTDAMPDTGFSEVPYLIQQGLRQTGHAALRSDNPVRSSNGEQGTFVYYVEADNLAQQQDRFDLSVKGVPAGWDVTLPASTIRIDGNSSQPFPVVVSTPFAHQHGNFEAFVLQMKSHRDPSAVGQLQMGIRFLEVPQPAGHHDKVWIHARSSTGNGGIDLLNPLAQPSVAYMNAAEEDGVSQNELQIAPTSASFSIAQSEFEWTIWLEPGLQLGMNFDLSRTGTLEVEFTSDIPYNDVILSGQLVHYEGASVNQFGQVAGKETLLGDLAPTTPTAINGPTRFETIFTAKPEADFLPYDDDAALALRLHLQSSSQGPIFTNQAELVPRLLPTGALTLPLFEYRDPVKDIFNALAGMSISHASPAERFVNPGETVLMNLTLHNDGAVDDIFSLRVNGTNQDWARFLGDTTIFVPTGGSRAIVVAISPPTSALDGDVIDLIVTAASDAEPTVQTQTRIVGIVDDLIDRPDETHLTRDIERNLTDDKDSPGVSVALLLAGLAAIVLRRQEFN